MRHGVHINEFTRAKIHQYLELKWTPQEIANHLKITHKTVYLIRQNLELYDQPRRPPLSRKGRSSKVSTQDIEALTDWLTHNGWGYLDEMRKWLQEERSVIVSDATVSRLLKRNGITEKNIARTAIDRSDEVRSLYRQDMALLPAESFVFLDESIFTEKTGWRRRGRSLCGREARQFASMDRGDTWAVVGAITADGWVSYGYKQGYYSIDDFLSWLNNGLLPHLEQYYPGKQMVIILDNLLVHVNGQIPNCIRAAGHLVRYLPCYSPDYNPIEMVWAVIKAWIRRYHIHLRWRSNNFGEFLARAIRDSRADQWALKFFKHAAFGIYIDNTLRQRLNRQLNNWADGGAGGDEVNVLNDYFQVMIDDLIAKAHTLVEESDYEY